MPCMKCSNGKYKYGEHGKCVFDTLAACKKAAAAIHVQENDMTPVTPTQPIKPTSPLHDPMCQCAYCMSYRPM